jgi:hypothetical protein
MALPGGEKAVFKDGQANKAKTTPPAMAEPICPAVLAFMACINKKLEKSSFWANLSTTRTVGG